MSTKPLQQYFDTLFIFAEAPCKKVDRSTGIDLEKVRALRTAGCVTAIDVSDLDGFAFKDVSISPHGAVVLAEWGALLERSSIKGKILSGMEKVFWLAAGVLVTVGIQILIKVL